MVPVGLGIAILTFLLVRLINFYIYDRWGIFYLPWGESESWYDSFLPPWRETGTWHDSPYVWYPLFMGRYVIPALHFLLTFLGASWVARRVGEGKVNGLLIGLLAGAYNQIIMILVWPTASLEQMLSGWGLLTLPVPRMIGYLALGMAGGFLGSATAWAMLARREALYRTNRDIGVAVYRASRDIGVAGGPREISTAIANHLARRDIIGVSLWRATDGSGQTAAFSQLEVRIPRASGDWPFGEQLDATVLPALTGLRDGTPVVAKRREVRSPEREACKKLGGRSILVVPLVAPREEQIGLLMVISRRRWAFSEKVVRGYMTVGAQAALALENIRLVEEARRVGQEAGVLRERNRLSREIHDTLAQGFISIVMNLEAAESDGYPEKIRQLLERIERTARESLSEARRLVQALGPEQLEGASLPEALEDLARNFAKDTGISADAVTDGESLRLPQKAESALLRTAQEALSNIRKHAEAGRVALTLSYMGDRVVLDVRDDGVGFDPGGADEERSDGTSGGFGLEGIRGRIEEAGGTLHVESAPGEGTTLTVEMPAESPRAGMEVS